MKKTIDNPVIINSKLDSHLDNNENNLVNDNKDGFVLFPLDVQENIQNSNNQSTQNNVNNQDEDFILFPLDINKSSTSSTNKGSTIYKAPKKQFFTNPNPRPIVNPQLAPGPTISNPIVKSQKSNKLRNLFWLIIIISLSVYTYKYKETNQSYFQFYSKTIHGFTNFTINKISSFFKNEADFIKYKKDKKIIVTVPMWNFDTQRIESGYSKYSKSDSVIILPTGRRSSDRIEVIYMLNKFEDFKLNKIDTMYVEESLLNEKSGKSIKENRGQIPLNEFD